MQSVIYLFVSPSGRAYAGKHAHAGSAFPRRGTGPLPSGYQGSGKLWQNVARKHGPNLRWIVLRRFGPDTPRAQVDAAERRAVRLVRSIWAGRCVNVREGGEGLTTSDAQALWADPTFATANTAAIKEAMNRPDNIARLLDAQPRAAAASKTPEALAKLSQSQKLLAVKPERAEQLARAREAARSPEVRAKATATKQANIARRKLAALEQAHEGRADPLLGVHEVRPDTLP